MNNTKPNESLTQEPKKLTKVILAAITVCVPDMGYAIADTIGSPVQTIVAYLPFGDYLHGSGLFIAYPKGTIVAVAVENTTVYTAGQIIYALNCAPDTLKLSGNAVRAYLNEPVCSASKDIKMPVVIAEEYAGKNISWAVNHSHSVDPDIYPGDLDLRDKQGGAGVHIGRDVLTLRGSSAAFIDVVGITNRVRSVAASIEQHSLIGEHVLNSDYYVRNTAVSAQEALGVDASTPGFDRDEETEVLQDSLKSVPFYRIQHIEGAVADGVEDQILEPGKFPHTSEEGPLVLARRRSSLSGELSSASAYALASIKSPVIDSVQQLGYQRLEDTNQSTDLRQPFGPLDMSEPQEHPDLSKFDEVSEDDRITDAAILKIAKLLTSGDYRDRLISKMAELGMCPGLGANDRQPELGNLKIRGTAGQQYPLPESFTLTDPVTGQTKTYYDTTSFISQEPDGSICICDGYGSEIRMCRGNIYISPALDLFLRPGRDMSVMAGRHQSYNSQKTCTVHSSEGMYIMAEDELKMAGGNNTVGSVSIECKSRSSLRLKSLGSVSVAAKDDIYIGRSNQSTAQDKIISEVETSGSVIIDAGKFGSVYNRASGYTVDANEALIGAFNQESAEPSSGTGLHIQEGRISLLSSLVVAPAHLYMQQGESTPSAMLCRNGKEVKVTLKTAISGNLLVPGYVIANNGIVCNGQGQFNQSLVAKGVISTSPECSVISPKRVAEVFKPWNIPKSQLPKDAGKNAEALTVAAATGVYQDKDIAEGEFRFPDYVDVALSVVPGMTWQQDNPLASTWKEPVVVSVINNNQSMCYPGKPNWESARVSTVAEEGYSKDRLKLNDGGYKINI